LHVRIFYIINFLTNENTNRKITRYCGNTEERKIMQSLYNPKYAIKMEEIFKIFISYALIFSQ